MTPPELPFARIATAILLGMPGPLLLSCLALVGMQSLNGWDGWTVAADFALMAVGAVLLVGLPLAGILLRDPAAPLWRWAAVGAGSACLAAVLYGLFLLGPMFLFLLSPISFPGMMVCMLIIAVMVLGGATGTVARTLLPFLDRR